MSKQPDNQVAAVDQLDAALMAMGLCTTERKAIVNNPKVKTEQALMAWDEKGPSGLADYLHATIGRGAAPKLPKDRNPKGKEGAA